MNEYLERLFSILAFIDKEDLTEFFNERAAVREYEANMTRADAEGMAFQDTIDHFYIYNHINQTSAV